jgi:hypothetical protein
MFGDLIKYEEKPAKGKTGFLLYSPFRKTHFFRVYDGENFKDYDLIAEEVEIKIVEDWVSLYESEERNKLDFSSKALGKE